MKKLFFAITMLILLVTSSANVNALTIEYDGTRTEYSGSIYSLRVNGKKLTLPLDPIIFNDRALVPVREVFEALNAKVSYIEKTKCVDISYNGNSISLYINNPAAYINGKKAIIPDGAVPKLINKVGEPAKTMVPVRFISESLQMTVEFNDPVISISNNSPSTPKPTSKPTPTPKPTATLKPSASPGSDTGVTANITKLTYSDTGNETVTAKATISGTPGKVEGFILSNPTRLVVDIYKCNYKTSSAYAVDLNGISKIRVGFENGRARLVFDAENISSTVVTISNNILTVKIGTSGSPSTKVTVVNNNQSSTKPSPTPTTTPIPLETQQPVTITDIPYAEHKNSDKLIVIDAGHGGKDGGATGRLGENVVLEKTLTLQIAKRVKTVLESRGYTVKLTRETDEYPSLQARANFANNSNAAAFISIHINSVESNPEASGTETFYASLNNDTSYKLKSSYLAKYIQEYLIGNLKSKDRGVKQSEHLVTRSSIMPAVLIEVGFISNEKELSNMVSTSYQQKTAEAIAAGIIKGIDKIEIPSNRSQLLEERKKALEEWEKTQ